VGIHGLHRPREWDEVAVVDLSTATGNQVGFVALPDGSFAVESSDGVVDLAALVEPLGLRPPFRAEAIRRSGTTWAVGARAIETAELSGLLSGQELEVVWDGTERSVRIDGEPSFASVPELERLAASRFGTWVARARRIRDDIFEIEVGPL
jgi:hypothetical protein